MKSLFLLGFLFVGCVENNNDTKPHLSKYHFGEILSVKRGFWAGCNLELLHGYYRNDGFVYGVEHICTKDGVTRRIPEPIEISERNLEELTQ